MITFRSIYIINKRNYIKIKQNKLVAQNIPLLGQSGGKYNDRISRYDSNIKKNYNKCGAPSPDGSSNNGCGNRSYE